MPPNRQITDRQLQLLVEFAVANKNIVLGNLGKGPHGQQVANRAWKALTLKLNAIGGGVIKTPEKWKRYWHLLKCRTKAKAADSRRKHMGTGSGHNLSHLSDVEKRIVGIMGEVADRDTPGVRIPENIPKPEPTSPAAAEHQSDTSSIAADPSYHDDSLPSWAFELEERRIALEERRLELEERRNALEERRYAEQERISANVEGIRGCLQQLVELLQARFE